MHTNHENTPIKHTPSPWRAEASGIIFDAGGNEVAHVIRTRDLPLIAAAPELLSVLKCLLIAEMLRETAMSHGDDSAVEAANEAKWSAVDAARDAIAKAEGK